MEESLKNPHKKGKSGKKAYRYSSVYQFKAIFWYNSASYWTKDSFEKLIKSKKFNPTIISVTEETQTIIAKMKLKLFKEFNNFPTFIVF